MIDFDSMNENEKEDFCYLFEFAVDWNLNLTQEERKIYEKIIKENEEN